MISYTVDDGSYTKEYECVFKGTSDEFDQVFVVTFTAEAVSGMASYFQMISLFLVKIEIRPFQ